MRVSYWIAEPVRYKFIEPFNRHRNIMECVAPYTPVRLIIEVTN